MWEMHPIDEQFKRLYDAEATPPEEVRSAIGHHLGWNKSTASGTSFSSTLLLLIGMVGGGVAIYQLNHTSPTPKQEIAALGEQRNEAGLKSAEPFGEQTTNTITGPNTSQFDSGANAEETGLENDEVSISGTVPVSTSKVGTATSTIHFSSEKSTDQSNASIISAETPSIKDPQRATPSTGAENTTNANDVPHAKGVSKASESAESATTESSGTANDPTLDIAGLKRTGMVVEPTGQVIGSIDAIDPKPAPANTVEGTWQGPIISIELIETRLGPLQTITNERNPLNVRRIADYVVPHGNWWVSIYGGMSSVKGKWAGAEAEALDRSETWKSGWQAGAMSGRAWRSGFSVGVGVGIARIRSTFEDERTEITYEATDLDTAWTTTNYPGTQIPISTWFIDTLYTPVSGPLQRTTANNQYTAIQIPVSLWWHKDINRWKLGATAGILGWVPMKQQGLTLARSSTDAEPTPMDISGSGTEQRFGMQLHGNAGLSLGYMLCEQLTVLAEPMLNAPLYTGNGNTSLSLTRPTLQLRLHYDIHPRIQRTN